MPKMKKREYKKGRRTYGRPEAPVVTRVKMPNRRNGEMFGRIIESYGQDRMGVYCDDGEMRIGRIRGKIKKRVWIRKGDLVIVNPWDFETNIEGQNGKCEISWRYLKHEVRWLQRKDKLPEVLDLNNISLV